MKKVISVVGARPNFMKVAPLCRALAPHAREIKHVLLHTGQHYDTAMSQVFFDELELPAPDIYLGVGSGSHGEQTARIMAEFEKVCVNEKPDMVLVVGDVNSTLACSIDAAKLNIPVAHIEAGLRSFDRTMPEEINRIVTDSISSLLFVTEQSGIDNLRNEGVGERKMFLVGNTMIDTLLHLKPKAQQSKILERYGLEKHSYCVVTLHRPSNVDTKEGLKNILELFEKLAEHISVFFPMHPRTKKMLESFGMEARAQAIERLLIVEPLGYLDFLRAMESATFVLTDSGGIQEETTLLGVPCITMRENTERPVTVEKGTNILAGTDMKNVFAACENVLCGHIKPGSVPPLWDGRAAERIKNVLLQQLSV
ncbi:MAG TPA: UDP-N-acetylglucosamine 2-epimerase (non-hydrolyzing) [Candidatus Kapabacteria bacterium]|nr:UDP-N-acetylglucosamine 2-epimerase (non-hydrolyzing) [Candidatus Kapabacteria bacterium]